MAVRKGNARFAVCLKANSQDDLQVAKVYRILPDVNSVEVGCLRVVDESGEDYLYAMKRFLMVDVPEKARGKLLKAVS